MKSGGCRIWREQARAPIGVRDLGREMPSFFIFQYNIDRFMPRRGGPLGSAYGPGRFTQGSDDVLTLRIGQCDRLARRSSRSGQGQRDRIAHRSRCLPHHNRLQIAEWNLQCRPGERITARSMKFCSSRMLPGH